jgi:hypothetical protein
VVRGVESGKFVCFCVYFSTRICSAGDLWRWKQKVLCSNNKRRRPRRSEEKRTNAAIIIVIAATSFCLDHGAGLTTS